MTLYIYLAGYVFLLITISYIVSRRQKEEDYFISSRNRPGWQIFTSKFAAAVGAAAFITFTGFAYEFGTGVLTFFLGGALGYLIFAYWAAPKIHKNSKSRKYYTMGDFVYEKTKNNFTKNLTNTVSIVIMFSWLITAIIGGAKIINNFGILTYNTAVIITTTVILIYLLLAGFKAVIITDVFQSIIIFVFLIVITFGITGTASFSELLSVKSSPVSIPTAIGFLIYGVLTVFSYSDRYQLSYAANNSKSLRHGMGLAVIPLAIIGFLLLLIGVFMSIKAPGLDPALVFPLALQSFLPKTLLPVAIVLFFAGIMSSADTQVYAISSHYALSKKIKSIKSIRISTIILLILTGLLAILFPYIIKVSLIAAGISLTLSIPMIYILKEGNNPKKFTYSVILSFIALVASILILGIKPIIALFVIIGSIIGLFISKKDKRNIPREKILEVMKKTPLKTNSYFS